MKHLSSEQIIRDYKKGRKDFTGIECKSGNFSGYNLKRIVFRNSNLEGSSFSGCNLDDADFSNCNLQWINFDHASLRRTKFANADLRWAKSTAPIFESTSFRDADLSEAYIFEADMGSADFTGASKERLVTKFSEVTDTDFMTAEQELRRRGISLSIAMKISSGIEKMKKRWKRFIGIGKEEEKKTSVYSANEGSYSKDSATGEPCGCNISYGSGGSIYEGRTKYRERGKK